VEYAKASPEDILIEITAHNRGNQPATLHLLPTIWFRNTGDWAADGKRPQLRQLSTDKTAIAVEATHDRLGKRFLHVDGPAEILFTENETNSSQLVNTPNVSICVKDGINNRIVHGRQDLVNPQKTGTKAAAWMTLSVEPGQAKTMRLRLTDAALVPDGPFGEGFHHIMTTRRQEADAFYKEITPPSLSPDAASMMRQALAGMLWSKQYFYFDLDKWLGEHGADPFALHKKPSRNSEWHHMYNADIISMPDKWEYPWYAAWDLAFHVLPLSLVDMDFAKDQLKLMVQARYQHPNGQLPAYEWAFGDVNPPVHAWSTIFTYRFDKNAKGKGDLDWLENMFQKLLMNFTWWVNRKDHDGNNLFDGGFLGLDNIGVFDRSAPIPGGGRLEQADGTAWMALFCQNMLEIAAELALERPAYLEMMEKFIQHFLWIASSMLHAGGGVGMWDPEDGFFYDVLRLPNGTSQRLKVRSMVGLLPLCAVTVYDGRLQSKAPAHMERLRKFLAARPELRAFIHDPVQRGFNDRQMGAVLNETNLRRVLSRMLDENEFLSPFGIRSLSRFHAEHPYVYYVNGQQWRVPYLPGESDTAMFGGNSNWRGPIWMPVNALIIRALLHYYWFYADNFKIECPTGSGHMMTLYQVAEELTRRLTSIFLRNDQGRRPVYGHNEMFQNDPHWRDLHQFYEYFHGDTGAGLGASHQTGWTGVIARLMHLFATQTPERTRADMPTPVKTIPAPSIQVTEAATKMRRPTTKKRKTVKK
jgi:hypothetical protein